MGEYKLASLPGDPGSRSLQVSQRHLPAVPRARLPLRPARRAPASPNGPPASRSPRAYYATTARLLAPIAPICSPTCPPLPPLARLLARPPRTPPARPLLRPLGSLAICAREWGMMGWGEDFFALLPSCFFYGPARFCPNVFSRVHLSARAPVLCPMSICNVHLWALHANSTEWDTWHPCAAFPRPQSPCPALSPACPPARRLSRTPIRPRGINSFSPPLSPSSPPSKAQDRRRAGN
jgi:hypothetical protein